MTIFQKMLLAPLLSLVLYTIFLAYSHSENEHNKQNIQQIRDDYFPVLEITNDSIRLFEDAGNRFKDAVAAGERDWLQETLAIKAQLEMNFNHLRQFPGIVEPAVIAQLQDSYDHYHNNAFRLAGKLISGTAGDTSDDQLIADIEQYHNLTRNRLDALKSNVHQRFQQAVDATSDSLHRQIVLGSTMAAVLLLTVASLALTTSLSTRRNLKAVIDGMRALASGGTDFSQRLDSDKDDELGALVFWFNRLSDKLEQDYVAIEQISITDKLTQLNNRTRTDAYLSEVFEQHAAEQTPLSIALLDIDHFKAINDNHGHLTGDDVLIAIAEVLKQEAKAGEFVGRWGGEEFILVLAGQTAAQAMARAEALRARIAALSLPTVGPVTASLGVAEATSGDSIDSLIKRADNHLYDAKAAGRNRVVGAGPA